MRVLGGLLLILIATLMALPARSAEVSPQETSIDAEGSRRLDALLNMSRPKKVKREKLSARDRTMSEAARTLGFQEGFKYEYERLLGEAEARRAEMERIYDFRRLLIDGKVLPPVIRWSGPAMELRSDTDAVEVEEQYRIETPARIVMSPPSWRDYLEMSTDVLQPAAELLPENSKEQELWREEAKNGWEGGVEHARTAMDMAFDKLTSDYRGILRFKMLADRGLVSVPVIAKGNLGIQVGDNVLSVDQKVFRITLPASFSRARQKEASGKKAAKKK